MNKKIIAVSVLIAILFVSSIAVTISYYNGVVNDKNSKIASLNSQILNQNNEITNLTNQITRLNNEIANLTSQIPSLKETETLERTLNGFAVIQITDTQYLSDSAPDLFNGLTSWIVDNSRALNVTMVVHTGDIVEVANSMSDWNNANNAMMQLYNNSVPYCWDAGNHDQLNSTSEGGGGNPNGSWLGGNYPVFNVTAMRQQPYWVGDISDGKDTAVQFTYGNYHFMIINIEYDANSTVLGWMQTLLKCNPNVNVIVATHNFLNGHGTYGGNRNPNDIRWATNFENLLNNYPNVFMTLNGHDANDGGSAYHKRVGNREEIFFNMQENDSKQGAATARIYAFNMIDPQTQL
jgi:hypothetical protein